MKLSDFVVPEAILPDLQATDRNGVIRELVDALGSAGCIEPDAVKEVARGPFHGQPAQAWRASPLVKARLVYPRSAGRRPVRHEP